MPTLINPFTGRLTVCTNNILHKKVSLTSAQILALFTTPQQLLPSPGVGFGWELINALATFNKVTTGYATNTNLSIFEVDVANGIASNNIVLSSTVSRTVMIAKLTPGTAAGKSYQTASALMVGVQTGNPTAGDGTLDILITYQKIPLSV